MGLKSLEMTESCAGRITVERGVNMPNTDEKERMTAHNYEKLIGLLEEKIFRLEREKDGQRKEINRLRRELKALQKLTNDRGDNHESN